MNIFNMFHDGDFVSLDRNNQAALVKDSDWYVRSRVLYALGQIGDSSLLETLKSAMSDPETKVRSAAAVNMSEVQSPRSIDVLLEALHDPAGEVRSAAALALAKVGNESVLPQLEQMQQYDVGYTGVNPVKDAATYAIQQTQARSRPK